VTLTRQTSRKILFKMEYRYDPLTHFRCKHSRKLATKNSFIKVKKTSTKLQCDINVSCESCHKVILQDKRTFLYKDDEVVYNFGFIQF
jgi:hypothetical protein